MRLMYPTSVRNLSLLLAISVRNLCSIWRVVPNGYLKASCHDSKVAKSITSEAMTVQVQPRQYVQG
jgi:hypothetical protein